MTFVISLNLKLLLMILVCHFGLGNAVIPIGKDFLEVVSPVQEDTTAGRFIDKRNGDGVT